MSRATILVVDDEPAIHRFLHPSLTAEGYAVLQAMTGAQALAMAAERKPDALVLDLGLPDIDGKVVIERLRRVSDVPIVVLSARATAKWKRCAPSISAPTTTSRNPSASGS